MKKTSKTIVFFGNEKLATGLPPAIPIIRNAVEAAGFQIEQVVTGKLTELKPHNAQLAVLAAYGQIIPSRILNEFPLGIINIHPSLLPQYRGPTPIEQAILDGSTKTGVSIMQLTAGMDEGPIYKQKTVPLTGSESKAELTEKLQRLGSELLIEVLPAIADGTLAPRQQPHPDRATYSKKIEKSNGRIDWEKPAAHIEREIRAYLGWPGSQTTLADKEVTITQAHAVPVDGTPGTVEVIKGDKGKALVIYCGSGYLCIERLKPSGKAEMDSTAFLAGYGNRLA